MAKMWIVEDYDNGDHYLFDTKEKAVIELLKAYIKYFDQKTPDAERMRNISTVPEILDDLKNILNGHLWDSVYFYDVEVDGEITL